MSLTLSGTAGVTYPDATVAASANVAASQLPNGSVVQVVSTLYATQGSMIVGTSDTDITGMTHTITPLRSGSRFHITMRLFMEIDTGWDVVFNILRNGSRINVNGGTGQSHGITMPLLSYGPTENDSTPEMLAIATLDVTGSTAGTPIIFKLAGVTSGVSKTCWINRTFGTPLPNGHESGTSEIIIMEIAA